MNTKKKEVAMRLNQRFKKLEKAMNPSNFFFSQAVTQEEAEHKDVSDPWMVPRSSVSR